MVTRPAASNLPSGNQIKSKTGRFELKSEDFIKMMITQLQNQDPMEPAKNEELLAQMMDAFASIVSNNLNGVMKVLTAATILLAIPTVVASLWGMTVVLPFAQAPWAFAALVAGCVAITAVVAVLFAHRRWL